MPSPSQTPLSHRRPLSRRRRREGEVAPMSLRTYAEVRPWTKAIHERVVREKSMPPWHADPQFGEYANDARLSDAQIAVLDKWIKTGAKLGNDVEIGAASTIARATLEATEIGDGTKIDNHGLPPFFSQLLRHQPGDAIVSASGRFGNHQANGFARIVLGPDQARAGDRPET